MKNLFKHIFLYGTASAFLFSCSTPMELTNVSSREIKSTRIDYKELKITKDGIFQKPLVTDLEVAKQRVFFSRTYENMNADEAKDNVNGEFSIEKNCDIVVQPLYETNTTTTDVKTTTTVTISGYPAYYKNIRTFEPKDTQAFLIHNYIGSYNNEKPKTEKAVVTVTESVQQVTAKKKEEKKKAKTWIGMSADYALAHKDWKDFYKNGYGASLMLLSDLKKGFYITSNLTYLNFQGKEYNLLGSTLKPDPLGILSGNLGLRYKTPFNIYLESRLGYYTNTDKAFDNALSGLQAVYSIGLSYKKLDLSLRREVNFEDGNNLKYSALRLGFYF
jgi:hypothetical protein